MVVFLAIQINRECVFWRTGAKQSEARKSGIPKAIYSDKRKPQQAHGSLVLSTTLKSGYAESNSNLLPQPAPFGQKIPLYQVAHSRAGDKGNDLNFSIIPHLSSDFERLKVIITPTWVKAVVSALLDESSFPNPSSIDRRNAWIDEHVKVEIYEVKGIHALNVVVRNILDGGVNCSRRIDRHGKCVSDLILCQQVVLPP